MPTYTTLAVATAAECTERQMNSWVKAITEHGLGRKDGKIAEDHAIAIGAALRFSQAGIGKDRVNTIFKQLLRELPTGDEWIVVDRRNRSQPIAIEKIPFNAGTLAAKNRIPISFDPVPFVERLRQS